MTITMIGLLIMIIMTRMIKRNRSIIMMIAVIIVLRGITSCTYDDVILRRRHLIAGHFKKTSIPYKSAGCVAMKRKPLFIHKFKRRNSLVVAIPRT